MIQPVDASLGQPFRYAYTIGLMENGGIAELLIAGIPHELSAYILGELSDFTLANSGMPPSEWDVPVDDETSYQLRPVWVTRPSNEMPMHMAVAYYGTRLIPTVQYVWPTDEGTYPWDAAWPQALIQPVGGNGRPLQ